MNDSPIDELLRAVDKLDADAVIQLCAPGCRLLTADGHRSAGTEAMRELVTEFFAGLRSATHRTTSQWHQDNVWIAEVDASYELRDWLRLEALPRVFIVRTGPGGITDLRIYGAHEHPLSEHRTGEEGMWVADRWIPPL